MRKRTTHTKIVTGYPDGTFTFANKNNYINPNKRRNEHNSKKDQYSSHSDGYSVKIPLQNSQRSNSF